MRTTPLALSSFFIAFMATCGWRLSAPPAPVPMPPPAPTDPSMPATEAIATPADVLERIRAASSSGSDGQKTLVDLVAPARAEDIWEVCGLLGAMSASPERDKALLGALEKAAAMDPFRAWNLLMQSRFSTKHLGKHRFRAKLVETDPHRAWKMLTDDGQKLDDDVVRGIAEAWAKKWSYEALEFGAKLSDPGARKIFLSSSISRVIRRDLDTFLRWFDRQPDKEQIGRWVNPYIFSGWVVGEEPPVMELRHLDFLATLDLPEQGSDHPMSSFLSSAWWYPELRKMAPEWIARQSDPALRDAAWVALIAGAKPHEWAGILARVEDPALRADALGAPLRLLAYSDPASALSHAQSITDEEGRRIAVGNVFDVWTSRDPTAALAAFREISNHLSGSELSRITDRWSGGEGTTEMLALLARHPSQPDGLDAASSLADGWIENRPAEVERWLSAGASGPLRDAVAASAVKSLSFADGSTGMALAQSIHDSLRRSEGVRFAFERWLASDAPAAKQWLRSGTASLSPADHDKLLKLAARNTHPDPRSQSWTSLNTVNGRRISVAY